MKWSLVFMKDMKNKQNLSSLKDDTLNSDPLLEKSESEEATSSEEDQEKTDKFTNLVSFLEGKLGDALKKKNSTMKKYNKFKSHSIVDFESSEESIKKAQKFEKNMSKNSFKHTKEMSKMILE